MKFKMEGRELEVKGIRVGELCEAEKALQVNMSDGTGAAVAITLFVGLRREDREKPIGLLADEVMAFDMATFEEVEEEEGPLAETGAANGTDPEIPLISGRRPSEATASR